MITSNGIWVGGVRNSGMHGPAPAPVQIQGQGSSRAAPGPGPGQHQGGGAGTRRSGQIFQMAKLYAVLPAPHSAISTQITSWFNTELLNYSLLIIKL